MSATLGYGQVAMVDLTATHIVAVPANTYLYLTFQEGVLIFLGDSLVTQTTGFRFDQGVNRPLTLFFHTMGDLYGIVPDYLGGITPTVISYLLLA